jgi:hypothetical protein
MVLLPNTKVLIINDTWRGCQGFKNAFVPTFKPMLYDSHKNLTFWFSVLNLIKKIQIFHSTTNLLSVSSSHYEWSSMILELESYYNYRFKIDN